MTHLMSARQQHHVRRVYIQGLHNCIICSPGARRINAFRREISHDPATGRLTRLPAGGNGAGAPRYRANAIQVIYPSLAGVP